MADRDAPGRAVVAPRDSTEMAHGMAHGVTAARQTAAARMAVGRELTHLRGTIAELSRELDESRKATREARAERDRAEAELVRADVLEMTLADVRTRWQAEVEATHDALRESEKLSAANEELEHQIAALHRTLVEERHDGATARHEIALLREEVRHLRAIVDLLLRDEVLGPPTD